jgi:hypothetical protein
LWWNNYHTSVLPMQKQPVGITRKDISVAAFDFHERRFGAQIIVRWPWTVVMGTRGKTKKIEQG